MKRIISFATGNLWRWAAIGKQAKILNHVKELDVDGVELTFSSARDLFNFRLSDDDISFLRSLSYVSIHAPFRLVRRAKNEDEVIAQLDAIAVLYKKIDAKNVVIHPTDLPAPEILNRYRFKISTENMVPKNNISLSKLKKIIKRYKGIDLCLDVSHAYLYSVDETKNIINTFKDKISQIHLSGTYRKRDHRSLQIVTKNFLKSIGPIKGLDCPIVIEEDFESRKIDDVKKEIVFIKRLLL